MCCFRFPAASLTVLWFVCWYVATLQLDFECNSTFSHSGPASGQLPAHSPRSLAEANKLTSLGANATSTSHLHPDISALSRQPRKSIGTLGRKEGDDPRTVFNFQETAVSHGKLFHHIFQGIPTPWFTSWTRPQHDARFHQSTKFFLMYHAFEGLSERWNFDVAWLTVAESPAFQPDVLVELF